MRPKEVKMALLTAFVFCIVTISIASNSYATGFSICLDTLGDSGQPPWARTLDNVKVEARINGVYTQIGNVGPLLKSDCIPGVVSNQNTYHWTAHNVDDVTAIRITTDGEDGAFIDRVLLYHDVIWTTYCPALSSCPPYYEDLSVRGVNNNTGWCLSTSTEELPSSRVFCVDGDFFRYWALSF